MSTRKAQPTYSKTTEGTVRTETDNPALLALVRGSTTPNLLEKDSQKSFLAQQVDLYSDTLPEELSDDSDRWQDDTINFQEREETVFANTFANTVPSLPTQQKSPLILSQHLEDEALSSLPDEHGHGEVIPLGSGASSVTSQGQQADRQGAVKNGSGEVSSQTAQYKHSPHYPDLPPSPDFSRSPLEASLTTSASEVHHAEDFDHNDISDDKGEEEEEQRDAGIAESTEGWILNATQLGSVAGVRGVDVGKGEDIDNVRNEKSSPVPNVKYSRHGPHAPANRNTSVLDSHAFFESGLPSPDLQNSQYQRFITPYASRRLKHQTPREASLSSEEAEEALAEVTQTPAVPGEIWPAGEADSNAANANNSSSTASLQEVLQTLKVSSTGEVQEEFSDIDQTDRSSEPRDSLEVSPSDADADVTDKWLVLDSGENQKERNSASRDPQGVQTGNKSPKDFDEPGNTAVSVPKQQLRFAKGNSDTASFQISPSGSNRKAPESPISRNPSVSGRDLSGMLVVKPDRVYVESPTFTREEEERYRFVSSRVEDYEESDSHPTFRGLDEVALKNMEGPSARAQPTRKPVKQVRYVDDEDRYEDRDETLLFQGEAMQGGGNGQAQGSPTAQRQYVMKSKTGSASTQRQAPPPAVKGLVLPSRPSFDPADEEELSNEISYQEQLRFRIDQSQKVAEDTVVPRLRLGGGESEDFAQDSLDVPEDIELDSERYKPHGDSLEAYHHHEGQQQVMQNDKRSMQWGDPPSLPAPLPHGDFSTQPSHLPHIQQVYSHDTLGSDYGHREGHPTGRFSNRHDLPESGYRDHVSMQYYPEEISHQQAHFSHGYAPTKHQQLQQHSSQFRQLAPLQPQHQLYHTQQLQRHQHPQQPDAYYSQEQDQYLLDTNPGLQDHHPQIQRTGHYMDRGGSPHQGHVLARADVQDGYYMMEPQGYGTGRGQGDQNQHGIEGGTVYGNPAKFFEQNSYEADDDETPHLYTEHETSAPLEMGKPPMPSYDFISNNKVDYGRAPRRTYKKIHEVKKEEKEKLANIFVTPKGKKKGSDAQLSSRDNSLQRYPVISEDPRQDSGEVDNRVASDAEHLWAQRSATLAQTRATGRKKQHSNSSLSSMNSQRMNLSNASFPSSASQNANQLQPSQMGPVHLPLRRPLELNPIHQEVVTEDGQRISVDVNLRLISPRAGGELEGLGQENVTSRYRDAPRAPTPRWTGQQYPIVNALSGGQKTYALQDENEYRQSRYSADDALASKKFGALASGYLSDSHHDYSEEGNTMNPYPKIPPIPIGSDNGAPRSAPVMSDGGYMQAYLREKEKQQKGDKPWYRVYNLHDYKRMQKEVRLGTLGPDLDNETFKERREKVFRQSEYARGVKEKNAKELMTKKPPVFPRPREQDDIISKRRLAVEYAKNVPKPTVRPKPSPFNSYELASQMSPLARNTARGQQQSPHQEASVVMLDLEKLHQRHEEDKRSAELIRQKAQGIWS